MVDFHIVESEGILLKELLLEYVKPWCKEQWGWNETPCSVLKLEHIYNHHAYRYRLTLLMPSGRRDEKLVPNGGYKE